MGFEMVRTAGCYIEDHRREGWERVCSISPIDVFWLFNALYKITPPTDEEIHEASWYPWLNKGYVLFGRKNDMAVYLHDGRFYVYRKYES